MTIEQLKGSIEEDLRTIEMMDNQIDELYDELDNFDEYDDYEVHKPIYTKIKELEKYIDQLEDGIKEAETEISDLENEFNADDAEHLKAYERGLL
jgi:predicted RNase H-like nuclease (RuvC/YqgF family)